VLVKRRREKSTTTVAINRKQYLPATHTHTHNITQRQEQVKYSIAEETTTTSTSRKGDSLFCETKKRSCTLVSFVACLTDDNDRIEEYVMLVVVIVEVLTSNCKSMMKDRCKKADKLLRERENKLFLYFFFIYLRLMLTCALCLSIYTHIYIYMYVCV